jgi:hypothetical protein
VRQAPPPPRLGPAAAARLRLGTQARRATGAERTAAAVPRAERGSPPHPSPSASRRRRWWRLGRLGEPVGVGPWPSPDPLGGRPPPLPRLPPSPPPGLGARPGPEFASSRRKVWLRGFPRSSGAETQGRGRRGPCLGGAGDTRSLRCRTQESSRSSAGDHSVAAAIPSPP